MKSFGPSIMRTWHRHSSGAPLLRSSLFVAAPGNHDIATRDLGQYPDGLAYFLYWDQPRNGPPAVAAASPVPPLIGPEANQKAFIQAAGDAYPRMASFSFDYGNAHWTVLDSNPYVDWTNPELRAWVVHDLANCAGPHVAICRLPSPRLQFLQGSLWRSADAPSGRGLRSGSSRCRI